MKAASEKPVSQTGSGQSTTGNQKIRNDDDAKSGKLQSEKVGEERKEIRGKVRKDELVGRKEGDEGRKEDEEGRKEEGGDGKKNGHFEISDSGTGKV